VVAKLHFHCLMTYKQHFSFCDIQIHFQTPASSHIPCYTFCTQMFRYIQFDHPTTFHTWPFLGVYFVDRRVGDFRKFPIPSHCYIFIFPKVSNYAGWWTHRFTFSLMLLYCDFDRLLPHSIPSHFSDHGFIGRQDLDCTSGADPPSLQGLHDLPV
jgi:hypothetical protein